MKKILAAILVLVMVMSLFLIPVTSQYNVIIKAPFLKTYSSLLSAENWVRWQPQLKSLLLRDSVSIKTSLSSNGFKINAPDFTLKLNQAGNEFYAAEQTGKNNFAATYAISPYKTIDNTVLSVSSKVSLIKYIFNRAGQKLLTGRAAAFKRYMETDSLYYGYKIVKLKVPSGKLIVIKATAPGKDKFKKAKAMFMELLHYAKAQNLQQVQPVIAQYLPKGADSSEVNVGLFLDREASSTSGITFVRMPEHGSLLAIHYQGKFSERHRAYTAMHKYFTDHQVQSAIAPFETYLGNKLPEKPSDIVDIQINFSTFL